ncbi:hypothetical protein QTP88_023623 [Uroleucon formosanum]
MEEDGGRISENIHELAEALTRPENAVYSHTLQTPPSTFFQQELVINGTSEGVIFANLDLEKTAPADLKSFLTFQVVFKSVSFLMVYVLLRSRTEETYITLSNIYTQMIVRYCHRKSNGVLDLVKRSPEVARVFRMVLALPHPLCPRFCMYDGFRAIMQYVQQFPEVEQGMKNFLIGYIEHYWFFQVGPEFFSVFGEDYRTNNYLESFHSILLVQMGRYPNVWDFLRKLTYIENQFSVKFNQVRNNLTHLNKEEYQSLKNIFTENFDVFLLEDDKLDETVAINLFGKKYDLSTDI